MSSKQKKKVFVAISGGVDSSVAALLLRNQGYDVTGVHLMCWDGCENNQDKQDAVRVAAKLGIPLLVWDFRKEYRERVYDYMIREYMAGRTPNPDVMCNKHVKFGIFLKRALKEGADYIATGHYVRHLETGLPSGNPVSKLFAAKDPTKDQSYFLWALTRDQLKYCLFPIGDYLKSEVRDLARKFGLPTAEKRDSQGLCFVGKIDFGDFLRGAIPAKRGDVLDSSGGRIGEHDGAHFYTLGQRHGLNIGGFPKPLYVAGKNPATNTLVVARGPEDPILYRKELVAENVNWISGEALEFPINCSARIRYRQPLQKAYIMKHETQNVALHASRFVVHFDDRQRAVAPGQSVVFYKEDGEMLGGGIISRSY